MHQFRHLGRSRGRTILWNYFGKLTEYPMHKRAFTEKVAFFTMVN